MKPCRAAKNEPAKPPKQAPIANAVSLVVGGVDAERAAGDLVLAQRLPGAPDRQPAQPHGDEGGERDERQDHVVEEDRAVDRAELEAERRGEAVVGGVERNAEEGRARNAGDAGIAVGDRHPVDQHEPDDLAEGERDDGEIVAAQPQHRKAEHDAPERGEDAGERQQHEERQPEGLRQQRVGIGADRIEGDVAEIEQAGEPDDDVEPEPSIT